MNKHKQNSSQTRQILINSFWELYRKKRIEKITVREITQKAGYNRGTFYEYFIDVYDVLEQIETSLLPEIEELPPLEFSESLPIDYYIKMYENNYKYYTVLLGEGGDPSFAGKLKQDIKGKLLKHFNPSEKEKLSLDYTLECMLSATIGVLTYWFQNECDMPKEQLIALMYEVMGSAWLIPKDAEKTVDRCHKEHKVREGNEYRWLLF